MNNKWFYITISDGTVDTAEIPLQFYENTTLDDVQKAVEKLGRSVCAYCGNEEDQADRQAILNHILTCEKRPERNLLDKAFEIETGLFNKLRHLRSALMNPQHFIESCDICKEINEDIETFDSVEVSDEMPVPQEKLP